MASCNTGSFVRSKALWTPKACLPSLLTPTTESHSVASVWVGGHERQPQWLYFTPITLPSYTICFYTHGWTHTLSIFPLSRKHKQTSNCLDTEDKELRLRKRGEGREGGGSLGWSMCGCMFVSVCFCRGRGTTLQDVLRMGSFWNKLHTT